MTLIAVKPQRLCMWGVLCACLFMGACSDDDPVQTDSGTTDTTDDRVKSYANYQIQVTPYSDASFSPTGETETFTVCATKEILWDGKPSGQTEPAEVKARLQGSQFTMTTTGTEQGLSIEVTSKENTSTDYQSGQVVVEIDEEGVEVEKVIRLSQYPVSIVHRGYKIVFERPNVRIPYLGYEGTIAFTCQCEKFVNGQSKGFENYSLNGIRYEATSMNDCRFEIVKGSAVGEYLLHYQVPPAVSNREVTNRFTFIDPISLERTFVEVMLTANPNGDDTQFSPVVTQGIYYEKQD